MNDQQPTTTALVAAQMSAMQICEQMPRLTQMGEALAKSGICGQISASTGTVVAMTCAQEGISLVQFKAKYHIMQDGNLAVKSRFLHAEFRRRGGKIHINKLDNEECDLTFSYDGEIFRHRVTLQQFKENGVAMGKGGMKTNWKAFPMDMLFNRCCATAIRKLCPEADGGLYAEEELADKPSPFSQTAEAQPRTLTADEVKSRIAQSAAPEQPVEVVETADASICPVPGKIFGKKWSDLRDDTLAHVLKQPREKYPELTDAHINAIKAILDERDAQAQKEAEAQA